MKGPLKAAGRRTQGLETQKQMGHNISQGPWGHAFSSTLIVQEKKIRKCPKNELSFSIQSGLISLTQPRPVIASREHVYIR